MERLRRLRAKSWESKVQAMEQLAGAAGFVRLRDLIIRRAGLKPTDQVLDVGAGTGLLTLEAAPSVERVIAVDVSPAMCEHLETKVQSTDVDNVEVELADAAELTLPPDAVDVVVSNYCLHHLRDRDKLRALGEIRRVLRPGGRVVFGDMMFNVGLGSGRDRKLIIRFIRAMLRRGPAGVIRLAKNVGRVLAGRGEHPRSTEWWRRALLDAGFEQVAVRPLDHEGGIATARLPDQRG